MSKLHFFYSVMNAGKSTHLLQAGHNYEQMGWNVYYFTSGLDNRSGTGVISSRVGISKPAIALHEDEMFYTHLGNYDKGKPSVVFVDEIQFFKPFQIKELASIVDIMKFPVLTYGLKNNSNGELFSPAIVKLMAMADSIKELKTVCHCGAKATQILRYRGGIPVISSEIVEIGAEDKYSSVCRKHWTEAFKNKLEI